MLLTAGIAFGAALLLTGLVRHFAIAWQMLDLPTARSSHREPTPRGGGLAVALVVLVGLWGLWWAGAVAATLLIAGTGGGALVALVGWFDDRGHVAARWRLLAHFTAAAWALAWLGGLPPLSVAGQVVDLGWPGHGLALVGLVWLLNLYNFMDGINGLAGLETVTVGLGVVLLDWLAGAGTWQLAALSPPSLLLVAAAAGFLGWNFPRARIFMGDAGSGFIGLLLGLLLLHGGRLTPELFWGVLILLGCFVVDATVTLLNRLLRKERVHEAHCNHAYQHAARRYGSHVPVTLAFAAINLVWLLPMASLVVTQRLTGTAGLLLAWLPLVILAWCYRAGRS